MWASRREAPGSQAGDDRRAGEQSDRIEQGALTARRIDALGVNRQRLTTLSTATPGTRLLPDSLFDVPQNILVPKDRPVREDAREQHHNVAAEAQGWTA